MMVYFDFLTLEVKDVGKTQQDFKKVARTVKILPLHSISTTLAFSYLFSVFIIHMTFICTNAFCLAQFISLSTQRKTLLWYSFTEH